MRHRLLSGRGFPGSRDRTTWPRSRAAPSGRVSDEEKPGNAHNAVTNIGDDLKIVRANMPFANTSKGEYGTYFIGYASTFSTTRRMLENMFIGSPAGNTDRLLDFSTAITGTLFFVPSYDLLGELGE